MGATDKLQTPLQKNDINAYTVTHIHRPWFAHHYTTFRLDGASQNGLTEQGLK